MSAESLTLNDKGFAVLGNALLLGYRVQGIETWFGSPEEREARIERLRTDREFARQGRQAISESRELREALESAGALDDRIDGPFDVTGNYRGERLRELADRMNILMNSDADIARLCLRDVFFSPVDADRYGIAKAIATVDPYELRTPLARLGSTPLTRRVFVLVLDWFRGKKAQGLEVSAAVVAIMGRDWDGVEMQAEHVNLPTPPHDPTIVSRGRPEGTGKAKTDTEIVKAAKKLGLSNNSEALRRVLKDYEATTVASKVLIGSKYVWGQDIETAVHRLGGKFSTIS